MASWTALIMLPRAAWRAKVALSSRYKPLPALTRGKQQARAFSSPRESRYGAAAPRVPTPTSPGPGPAPRTPPTIAAPRTALARRQHLMNTVPHNIYKVVGVSFEGRQALVAQLHRDQPMVFLKEPDNQFDPNAVAVLTLDGRKLGYIPRDESRRFLLDACFGFVASMGATHSEEGEELWGFKVAVQPSIPPVEVLAFPQQLWPYARLTQLLSGPAWEGVCRDTLQQSGTRCAVTGAYQAGVHEQWQFDEAARVVRLKGLRPLAPEVAALNYALVPPDTLPADEAAPALADMNAWRVEDAHAYLQHAAELQQLRGAENWKLDLGLLIQLGVGIPSSISPLRLV